MIIANLPDNICSSLHNHCTFCDGKNTAYDMAQTAFEKGITDFGFSCHGAPFYAEEMGGINNNNIEDYLKTVTELKKIYNSKMRIYAGIEQDYLSPLKDLSRFDYTIGAVHDVYCEKTGKVYWVDGPSEDLQNCIDGVFSGNAMDLVENFYDLTVKNIKKYKPSIIAHFDLIVKNNKDNAFFDENSVEYKKLALNALNECAKYNSVFEINTGGVYRGYRKTSYPDDFLLYEMNKNDVPVTISSDAHCLNAVNFNYEDECLHLKDIGFKFIYVFFNGNFTKKML